MKLLVLSFLLAGSALHADFDPVHWKLRRPITIATSGPTSSFAIDPLLYRGAAPAAADLRILHDGVETPYACTTLSGASRETELHPTLIDQGYVPGTGVRVALDVGREGQHNRLKISTLERNFRQRVRIETADNADDWAVVRDNGYIFDFSQGDMHVSVLTVDYPVSTKRYVRATVFGWTNIHSIESASLTFFDRQPAVRDVMATLRPSQKEDAATHSTILTADAGASGIPHNQVKFVVAPGYFYRAIRIDSSSNGTDWTYIAQGVLSRTPTEEDLTIDFPDQWDRYTRAQIYNGDDRPLAVQSMELTAFERVISFPSKEGGNWLAYYGNADAKEPKYDFGQIFQRGPGPPVINASLGAEQTNPAYRPPPPPKKAWTDEHPAFLYATLGIAVLAMGYVTVRFLLKVMTT